MFSESVLHEIARNGFAGLMICVFLTMLYLLWKRIVLLEDNRISDFKDVIKIIEVSTTNINRIVEALETERETASKFRDWVRSAVEEFNKVLARYEAERRALRARGVRDDGV